jgi:hypothetical protein
MIYLKITLDTFSTLIPTERGRLGWIEADIQDWLQWRIGARSSFFTQRVLVVFVSPHRQRISRRRGEQIVGIRP